MRILILLSGLLIYSLSQAQDNLEPSMLREDFHLFRQALQEAHPGLYRYQTKRQMDSIFDGTSGKLDHPMSRQEFYQTLSPVIAAIGCGHTKLHPDENWSSNFYFHSDKVFPWKLFISGAQAWVTGSWSNDGDTPTGSPLLSINGNPISDIINRLEQGLYSDGRNVTFKYIEMQKYFSALYANWYGGSDNFRVVVQTKQGAKEMILAPVDHTLIEEAQANSEGVMPYTLEFLSGHTALMTIASFWEESKDQSYKKFLKNSFSALRDSGTQHLIIDLRNNEGGNDYRGTLLLRYIARGPFRYYERLEATTDKKYSFADHARLPGLYGIRRMMLRQTDSGTYCWKHSRGLKTQRPFKNSFGGQVFVLINGASFSVTAEFAAVTSHLGRAVFIGEETGGGYYGNNSGTFVIATLPHSRLNVGIPMLAYYTAVEGYPWRDRGIMPDYRVAPGISDILAGKDPAMDLARKLPLLSSGEPDTVPIVMRTTAGDIHADLYVKKAPVTSRNFLQYIDRLGDKGGSFYRTVTPDNQPDKKIRIEVIQGGFDLTGIDTATLVPIPLERTRLTGLSHIDGTLSMARSEPDSGSTEFFICIGDQPSLDFGGRRNPDGQGFAAFGKVTGGMEVVRKIQQMPRVDQALTPEVRIMGIERVESR